MKQFVTALLFLLFSFGQVEAKSYTFTWSPNPEPVSGYKLYYKINGTAGATFNGTGAEQGDSPVDVGNVTTYTLTFPDDNVAYHFGLTAYDETEESGYSDVVTINPVANDTTAPAVQLLQINRPTP